MLGGGYARIVIPRAGNDKEEDRGRRFRDANRMDPRPVMMIRKTIVVFQDRFVGLPLPTKKLSFFF